jgi:nucleotide-binding universal stress UspA family protein
MFRRVVVALDGCADGERVLPWVRRLAGRGATLDLLAVRPPARGLTAQGRVIAYADQVESQVRGTTLAYLTAVAARLASAGFTVTTHIAFGERVGAIRDVALRTGAELVALVMDDTGGLRRLWRESLAEAVLRESPVPVLLARSGGGRSA